MQPTPSGGGGGGGVGGVNRVGLARFRSAPPTAWLEALLEQDDVEEGEDPLKPNQSLTQLLSSNTLSSRNSAGFGPCGSSSSSVEPGGDNLFEAGVFQRQNSSPADILVNSGIENVIGSYANYGIPSNYEYISPDIDVSSSAKRARDLQLHHPSLLKGEQSSQVSSGSGGGGMSSLIEMEMEKLLEDSVPCRIRAKRGFATHPRSIAERVRRTRISDRIRKLQELVPNMDKQTNTADMLDEAVEYVKFLQRQIQELTEHQRKCTCMAKE